MLKSLYYFWFPGLVISFYYFFRFWIGLEGENLEWITYFSIFIFILAYFFINRFILAHYRKLLFILLSIPFYSYLFLNYEFEYFHILLLIVSLIFINLENKKILDQKNILGILDKLVIYFVIFFFTSKLFYWLKANDFIFYEVSDLSKHIAYASQIELIVPVVFFVIFFLLFLLILFSFFYTHFLKINKIYLFLLVPPIFFLESFSTSGFFGKIGGGAMYHWQPIIGPNEMMQQGGYLLWDTPTSYGYLSHLIIDLIPLEDKWLSFYYLNGLMMFIFSIFFLIVIWNFRNIFWFLISFALTYAVIFLLPSGETFNNVLEGPANGPFRYFWIFILLFVLVKIKDLDFKSQFFCILPIYLIGFFWSCESAFFISAALAPYFFQFVFFEKNRLQNFLLFMLIPASIILFSLLIVIYYHFALGVFPDFYMFIAQALANLGGFFNEEISSTLSLIIHLIALSLILFAAYKNKFSYLFFCIASGIWSISSYFIGQSVEIGLLGIFVFYIFGFFLLLELFDTQDQNKYLYFISPVVIIILSFSFANPSIARHIYETLTHQDYQLNNVYYEEIDEFHEILTDVKPDKNIPIFYVEPSRYLNILFKHEYFDQDKKTYMPISDLIFLPFHPPSIIVAYSLERLNIYKDRWLSKEKFNHINTAIIIVPKDDYPWSRKITQIVNNKLSNYKVMEKKQYQQLQLIKIKKQN